MRCIQCKKKADVIKYGQSLCLYHARTETVIHTSPLEELKRLIKMKGKEYRKELDKLAKEYYKNEKTAI